MWNIALTQKAKKQLAKADFQTKEKILNFLYQEELRKSPKIFGKNLRGNLKKFWRYRVGDYRIICELKNAELVVLVIEIGHRGNVYKIK
jgi:mRNA interferase RelE/StbE